ncbi:MAG: sigma-70 family RNA polymerase sigma factor [Opitutales bacterium]|nr:sigma-70 family RNA polymerase sigma factor [Opitutales bacterium]
MQAHEPDGDALLMVRVAGGDTQALCTLIENWQAPLGNFVYRYVQNREATQELVQETFVRLYEARTRFDGNMKFSSWLFKIASNLCKNYYRWRSRHPESLGIDESFSCDADRVGGARREDSSPAEQSEQNDDAVMLERAVNEMPHQLKTALLLYYYENMSYKEIASALGCSPRGVETRLYRARAWLSKRLAAEANACSSAGICLAPEL